MQYRSSGIIAAAPLPLPNYPFIARVGLSPLPACQLQASIPANSQLTYWYNEYVVVWMWAKYPYLRSSNARLRPHARIPPQHRIVLCALCFVENTMKLMLKIYISIYTVNN